ncbi:hypothetical protein CC86DRAFT_262334, partial [Ophiobolus disseminans]
LGWSSFCLMPHDAIAKNWIEGDMRVPQVKIWTEVVKRVNPDVYHASQALDCLLGLDAIAGGPIGDKLLRIEAEAPAAMYEIEEVQD